MEGIKDVVRREMEAMKAAIRKRMDEAGYNASGKTSASLRVDVEGDTATLLGSPALLAAEHGRGPGSVPKDFVSIIRKWVQDRGVDYNGYQPKGVTASLSSEQKLSGLSGAIAYSIMKRGTVLHRKRMPRDIYSMALVDALDKIGSGVAGVLSLEIETIHQKYKKDENDEP